MVNISQSFRQQTPLALHGVIRAFAAYTAISKLLADLHPELCAANLIHYLTLIITFLASGYSVQKGIDGKVHPKPKCDACSAGSRRADANLWNFSNGDRLGIPVDLRAN